MNLQNKCYACLEKNKKIQEYELKTKTIMLCDKCMSQIKEFNLRAQRYFYYFDQKKRRTIFIFQKKKFRLMDLKKQKCSKCQMDINLCFQTSPNCTHYQCLKCLRIQSGLIRRQLSCIKCNEPFSHTFLIQLFLNNTLSYSFYMEQFICKNFCSCTFFVDDESGLWNDCIYLDGNIAHCTICKYTWCYICLQHHSGKCNMDKLLQIYLEQKKQFHRTCQYCGCLFEVSQCLTGLAKEFQMCPNCQQEGCSKCGGPPQLFQHKKTNFCYYCNIKNQKYKVLAKSLHFLIQTQLSLFILGYGWKLILQRYILREKH